MQKYFNKNMKKILTLINFRANRKVLINGRECTSPSWYGTSVSCSTPPGTGVANSVQIIVDGQSSVGTEVYFAYEGTLLIQLFFPFLVSFVIGNVLLFTLCQAPTITGIEPNEGPTEGGVEVTITGTGFGDVSDDLDEDGASDVFIVLIGGNPCENATWLSTTSLSVSYLILLIIKVLIFFVSQCITPEGVGSSNLVELYVSFQNATSETPVTFKYSEVVLHSIDYPTAPTSGGVVEIFGLNFGDTFTAFMGTYMLQLIDMNHTYAAANLPDFIGVNHDISVEVASHVDTLYACLSAERM